MKYRKKPIVIEAIQWDGDMTEEIKTFLGSSRDYRIPIINDVLKIFTYEGIMDCSLNDYIIKGIQGECYPCKPDVFKETYDKANTISIQDEIRVTQKFIDETIEHYDQMNGHFCIGILSGTYNKEEIIKEIKKLSEVGKNLLIMRLEFNKWLKEEEKLRGK